MNITSLPVIYSPFGLNAKDYGAAGDGVTNDAPAILGAIAAAVARGGGVIRIPRGTYYLNARITCAPNVSLEGEDMWETIFQAGPGVTTALLVGLGAAAVSQMRIASLTVDGNASALSGNVSGIQMSTGSNVLLERVRFMNIRDMGVNFLTMPDSQIERCEFYDTGQGGVNGHGINAVNGCHRLRVFRNKLWTRSVEGMGIRVGEDGNGSLDCDISHNYVDQTGSTGLECIGITPSNDGTKVIGNTAINGRDNGISCSADDMEITGNHARGANFHGIQSNGNNNTLTANVCKNNNQIGDANTRGGIHLNNTSGNVVVGNRCYDDQETKTQDYGVKGSGAEGINLVEANVLDGNLSATGNLSLDVVVRNNTGS